MSDMTMGSEFEGLDATPTPSVDGPPVDFPSGYPADECRCCSCLFKAADDPDDGIPHFCLGPNRTVFCLLNFDNPLFAKSRIAIMFSNIGFEHFDVHRRRYMGFAFFWTVLSFFTIGYACLAVVNHKYLIPFTHWAAGVTYDTHFPLVS